MISGFITASGILIAASQLKHILGVTGRRRHADRDRALARRARGALNLPTLAIGALAIGFLFWVRTRLKPLLLRLGLHRRLADVATKAGPVAAVLATTRRWPARPRAVGVRTVGDIPRGLPPLTLPPLRAALWFDLLPAAVLISLVGFVESVSVAQTLAAKRRQRIDPDQELVGLGAANVAAAFSGGYPVTGGFARSVVNFDAGAETPMAGVLTAVGIALTAPFLTPLFFNLPTATLAATIIVAVLALVDLGASGALSPTRRATSPPWRRPSSVRARGGHRGRHRDRHRTSRSSFTSGGPAGRTWRSSARCPAPSTSAMSCATR